MNQERELWLLEEQFWLGGSDFYERVLARHALMVFPPPVGILDRATTLESIRTSSRWQHVSLQQQQHVLFAGTAVLAYVAHADRGGPDTSYAAQCSSTYIRENNAWLLVLHHQTPVGAK